MNGSNKRMIQLLDKLEELLEREFLQCYSMIQYQKRLFEIEKLQYLDFYPSMKRKLLNSKQVKGEASMG